MVASIEEQQLLLTPVGGSNDNIAGTILQTLSNDTYGVPHICVIPIGHLEV